MDLFLLHLDSKWNTHAHKSHAITCIHKSHFCFQWKALPYDTCSAYKDRCIWQLCFVAQNWLWSHFSLSFTDTEGYNSWSEKACSSNKIGHTTFPHEPLLASLQRIHSHSENLHCTLICKLILSCKLLSAFVNSVLLEM